MISLADLHAFPGVVYAAKNRKDKAEWEMHYPLQWRGSVSAKSRNGILMLNPAACRKEKGSDEVS